MNISFENIVGYSKEKAELIRLSRLVSKVEELQKCGGKLPKGLFLIGPNGVGKTILAKAFIKESKCNVVIVDCNDAEYDFESYIKKKFKEAASKSPCILFIDELDKLIGVSNSFFAHGNMDKSRTILNEINKYSDDCNLFLLIVANKEMSIDYSITRSGRIDRIIEIGLPNQLERQEILMYYSKNKNIDKSVDYLKISQITRGFSGADIETLLNNAVINVFSDGRSVITNDDIMSAFYDRVFNNSEKESSFNKDGLKRIAYHEAGHAAITFLKCSQTLTNVSILSRGNIQGFVSRHDKETEIRTLQDKVNHISIALAGLISEIVFFGERTDGAASDLTKARSIASCLVRVDGYCGIDKVVPLPLSGEDFTLTDQLSQEKIKAIENAEDSLINKIYSETEKLITDNKAFIKLIARELIKRKTLDRTAIVDIYNNLNK